VDAPSSIDKALANTYRVVEAFDRRLRLAALLLLCIAVYVPGIIRLPAVDRTEVIYAETTRDMVARGNWLDPRYGDVVHAFRPVGTFWAQGLAAAIAGAENARNISVYRIPGLITVTLSVLALYWLAVPIVGASTAFTTAALFAVAPLTVVVANLAIAEGLSLLPATVAMLTLLRIYIAPRDHDTRHLATLFWIALGSSILINALLVPILVIATLIALRFMDRDMWWLDKLHAGRGLPIALAIAAPWIVVRFLQDGLPFSGLNFSGVLRALGGAQDMKLRAWPGTFVVAAAIGFLPGTAFLPPALLKLWNERESKLARFLLAWIIGYFVYLEALSSKPGTYMVQSMFPAFALAVSMLVTAEDGKLPLPEFHAIPWPPLAAAFAVALFAVPYAVLRETPSLWLLPLILATAALFYWSADEGRAGHLNRWAATGIAALALFAVTLLGGVLPSLDKIWPARQIQRVLANCQPSSPVGVIGFNEPTSRFVLNRDATLSSGEGLSRLADGDLPGIAVVDGSWYAQNQRPSALGQRYKVFPIACVMAINTMRGCKHSFAIVAADDGTKCNAPNENNCSESFAFKYSSVPFRVCD
jgi:4-amino-4-deoxy-L-arabinose transferase-like glycosyltransferase